MDLNAMMNGYSSYCNKMDLKNKKWFKYDKSKTWL